jgi:hypothetical protein
LGVKQFLSAFSVLATLALGFGFACKDYAYRHEIAGTIVDAKGAPVASVSVQRVTDKNDPYGVDELYKRISNDRGEFSFVSEGRGPSPVPSAPWRLQVDFGGEKRVYPVSVLWSAGDAGCSGYCSKSLVLSK